MFFVIALNINVSGSDKWMKVNSENFQIIGNANEKDLKKIAEKLEHFRFVFSQIYEKTPIKSAVSTNVLVFKDEASFNDFKPLENGKTKDWVAGYFQPGQDINYIVLSLQNKKNGEFRIIFHEYTHYLVNNAVGRSKIPLWLSEGLSEYYENIDFFDDQKVRLGNTDRHHIKTLQSKGLISAKNFFLDKYSLLEINDREEVSHFYAQSWALIHYLIHETGNKGNSKLANFLQLLRQNNNVESAFKEVFQTDFQVIENDLRKYIFQNNLKTLDFIFDEKYKIANELIANPISESEVLAYKGDLLFRNKRFPEAKNYLENALSLNSNLGFANVSLGLLHFENKNFELAKKYLEKAISVDPENFSAHFNYAFVLSREEVGENGTISYYKAETAEKIRTNLKKAIKLNPFFTDSYEILSFVSIVNRDEIVEALYYLEKGIEYASDNQIFVLRKSELLSLNNEFEQANKIASEIFEKTENEKIRELAKNTLEKIESNKRQYDRKTQTKLNNPYLVEENQILSDLELAQLHKKIEIDSINANLRKLQKNEQRIAGKIIKIECNEKGVVSIVKTPEENYLFVNKSFNGITFYTYKIELKGGTIGCETDLSTYFSIITFKPQSNKKEETKGEIVSVEFVPDYFEFVSEKKD